MSLVVMRYFRLTPLILRYATLTKGTLFLNSSNKCFEDNMRTCSTTRRDQRERNEASTTCNVTTVASSCSSSQILDASFSRIECSCLQPPLRSLLVMWRWIWIDLWSSIDAQGWTMQAACRRCTM
ncbi:hypothetical protein Tcan_13480 [Toxocara canis]|uniref:Uncharacterized protein n=1 Tax=Toxocara canis TaxID=6265 RepID=A0A0B2VPF5_TOXCA|nr:hypothetical protein Tcan_13480 [Toxocara canis]